MANDETLAALERAMNEASGLIHKSDERIIRAHIETLRNGGERAQIIALAESYRDEVAEWHSVGPGIVQGLIDRIKDGAHTDFPCNGSERAQIVVC